MIEKQLYQFDFNTAHKKITTVFSYNYAGFR